jgi:hypothetical protein
MWFHLYLGNHDAIAGRDSLYDMVEWLVAGLTELKHRVTVGDTIAPRAMNIVWDNFRPGDEQLIANRDFRFGLIATEIPTDQTFNWRDEAPWPERRRAFETIAPYAQFIWSTVEGPVSQYRRLAPAGYLELGFSEAMVDPIFSKVSPTFDFAFYGLLTPYRTAILDKLRRHCDILVPKEFLKGKEINRFIASAKIGICFKQSPMWPIPSPTRVGRLLHARRGIAAEFTPSPTRVGQLIPMANESEDFAEFCLECLREPWKQRADDSYDRFRATMRMRDILEKLLDTTFAASIADTGSGSLSGIDDKRRVKLGFSAATVFHLIGEEQGYNIVRRGREFYAVKQSLGPLDLAREIETILVRYRSEQVLAADTEQDARMRVQAVLLRQLAISGNWAATKAAIASIHHRFGFRKLLLIAWFSLRISVRPSTQTFP